MGKLILFMDEANSILSAECSILDGGMYELLQYLIKVVMIVVPILVVVLVIVDLVKAVTAGKEDEMKAAQAKAIKRIIIGLVIFFIPLLVDVVLKIAGFASGICEIG